MTPQETAKSKGEGLVVALDPDKPKPRYKDERIIQELVVAHG